MDVKRLKKVVYGMGGYVIPYVNLNKEVRAVYEVLMFLPFWAIRWIAIGLLAALIVGGVVYFAKWFTFPLGGKRRKGRDD